MTTGGNAVWFMNGATVVSGAFLSYASLSLDWQFGGAADFNGDGKPDIFLHNTMNGSTVLWYMDGTTVTGGVFLSVPAVGSGMAVAAIADFTGDGKPDIVWRNTATGAVELWTMDGA